MGQKVLPRTFLLTTLRWVSFGGFSENRGPEFYEPGEAAKRINFAGDEGGLLCGSSSSHEQSAEGGQRSAVGAG